MRVVRGTLTTKALCKKATNFPSDTTFIESFVARRIAHNPNNPLLRLDASSTMECPSTPNSSAVHFAAHSSGSADFLLGLVLVLPFDMPSATDFALVLDRSLNVQVSTTSSS